MPVLVRDLGQGGVEDGDVVGGGVRPGVARPQQPGQRFAGVVQVGPHRVIAERALERRRRGLFLAVADHDRGVQVDHQPDQVMPGRPGRRIRRAGGLGALRPDDFPGRRPGPGDRRELVGVELVQQPPHGPGFDVIRWPGVSNLGADLGGHGWAVWRAFL